MSRREPSAARSAARASWALVTLCLAQGTALAQAPSRTVQPPSALPTATAPAPAPTPAAPEPRRPNSLGAPAPEVRGGAGPAAAPTAAATAPAGSAAASRPASGAAPAASAPAASAPATNGTPAAASATPAGAANPPNPAAENPGGNPHGEAGRNQGVFQAPEDEQGDDPQLPRGTLVVRILDADDRPVPGAQVTLGILYTSVAKGENRKQLARTTDGDGNLVFTNLETGSGIAYRVSAPYRGGTFAASPFQLPQTHGARVKLHVYDVTSDVEEAMVVAEAFVYTELRDDRLHIQQAYRFYNFGRTAWVPKDLVLDLPEGYVALNANQGMSDVGITPVDGRGYRLRGTFGPGQTDVEFRWQLPYENDPVAELAVPLPPRIARARVIAPASGPMRLTVEGFPPAEVKSDGQGQRLLITDRQMLRTDAPLTSLRIALRDIPVEGPAKKIVTILAGLVVASGLAVFARRRESGDSKEQVAREREHLLSDLEELERAHRAGDVGPKTYESARRQLVDALARTFAAAT